MLSLPKVRAVFVKEMRDALRDRRTVFANFVIPLLLYPVILLLVAEATQIAKSKREKDTYVIAVEPASELAFVTQLIQDDETAQAEKQAVPQTPTVAPEEGGFIAELEEEVPPRLAFQAHSHPEAALKNGQIQAVLRLSPDFARQAEQPGVKPEVLVEYDQAEHRSQDAMDQVHGLFERYQDRLIHERLEAHGLGQAFLKPFELKQPHNVAPAQKVGGSLLGGLLPIWFIMMIIAGALHPAIDLTAGEKERGTLETLISAPVRPLEVITGKFLTVAGLAVANAILNMVSFGLTLYVAGAGKLMNVQVPWTALPAALLLLMPLTLFFAALLLAVASLAASSKEAQVYCTPILLIPMLGMIVGTVPGIGLEGPLTAVPVINTVLLIKELFLGHAGLASTCVFVFVSTCLYAAAAIALAVRVFAREEVLFQSHTSLRIFLQRRFLKPTPAPKAGDALLILSLIFPIWFYFSAALSHATVGQNQGATPEALALNLVLPQVLAILLLPLAVAWYLKVDLSRTFLWRMASARQLAAALCMGLSSWILVLQFMAWQSRIWPLPQQVTGLEGVMEQLPLWAALALFALTPALCEEHLFRGFLLSGLRQDRASGKVWGILVSGLIFGAFHYSLYRQPVTSLLGFALGYLAWEARSLWPGMLYHLLYNGLVVAATPHFFPECNLATDGSIPAPPVAWVAGALALFTLGLWLARSVKSEQPKQMYASDERHS